MLLRWNSFRKLAPIAAFALAGTVQEDPTDLISCLEAIQTTSTKSYLTASFSPAYETERLVFDRNFDHRPLAIYHPGSEEDAAAAIKCAVTHHVNVAVRSGGHSYEGYGNGGKDGALVINVDQLQSIYFDAQSGIVTVGAGVRLGPLYSYLWENGQYLIAGGTCPSVGISGNALGGGLGMLSRKYGMLSDTVVGLRIVNAAGEILQVDTDTNTDLFWALRGAGSGSFGVVTELKIQAFKAPEKVTTMLIHWPLDKSQQVIQAYGKWGADPNLPEDLFAAMRFEKQIELQINYLGTLDQANAALAPLIADVGEPSDKVVHEGMWMEAAILWGAVPNYEAFKNPNLAGFRYHRGRSLLYRQALTTEEAGIVMKYLTNPPQGSSKVFVILDIWSGKIDRPATPSAFDAHRGVYHSINLSVEWQGQLSDGSTSASECLKWSSNFTKELQEKFPGGVLRVEAYQNYIERDLPNWMYAYFRGGSYRLQTIKAKNLLKIRLDIIDEANFILLILTPTRIVARPAHYPCVQAVPLGLEDCLENIKSRSTSSLVLPSSSLYDKHRVGFNHYFDHKPSAIFHPASEAEAAAAILCAAANDVPVAPRSGGHSYEGYSNGIDGSLVIDLSQFQQFSLDLKTKIATFGAGTRLGHVYTRLWEQGEYLVPAGTCPTVGIGGHGLGGGFGVVARKYGLLTHNIVSMTMIAANGTILTVNKDSHPDLFWALRGAGGGSFGLVTEFRVQAYKVPATVTTALLTYSFDELRPVFTAFATWGKNAPEELVVTMYIDQQKIELEMTYLGSQVQMEAAIKPFIELIGSKPTISNFEEGSWYKAATRWGLRSASTLEAADLGDMVFYHRGRSLFYRQGLSSEELDVIEKYLKRLPGLSRWGYILVDLWGGKIDRPNVPSAFDNHQGVLFSIQTEIFWSSPNAPLPGFTCETCLKWSSDFAKELQDNYSSGPTLEAYQNYIERDLPDAFHAYYGDQLPRLQQVKKSVDPDMVFDFPQAIPLP
ncbi:hypothetical protein BGZ73_008274 [Actinomortierella ambigua]|nr:hypothetical protein BGZ73_008274 [Actinomortierella ambigua]